MTHVIMGLTPSLAVVDGEIKTTSLAIADHFGKAHPHVLEKIRNLDCSPEFSQSNFRLAEYLDEQGKPRPIYELTRDGFTFLAMGFTGPRAARWKEAYIRAFNEMETALRARASQGAASLETLIITLMGRMIDLQQRTLDVLEAIAPKPRTRRKSMADDVAPIKKMHADGMTRREISALTGIPETTVYCIIHDRFEVRPDGQLKLLGANIQLPADGGVK